MRADRLWIGAGKAPMHMSPARTRARNWSSSLFLVVTGY